MKIVIVLISAVLIVASCSSEKRDRHSSDTPWAWPDNGYPVPTDAQWAHGLNKLVEWNNNTGGFQELDDHDMTTQIDFIRNSGMWFCAIISKRNQSIGVFRAEVGWLRGDRMGIRSIRQDLYHINENEMGNFLHFLETDSLWTYFGEYRFWNDEDWFEAAYDTAGGVEKMKQYQWTSLVALNELRKPNSPHDSSDSGNLKIKTWLTVSFMLINNVAKQTKLSDSSLADLTPRQETFISHGKYFAGLFSRRNLDKGTYIAVVGQRLSDSIIYRHINDPQLLTGKELNNYIDLSKHDSVWSLIGPREQLNDEAGLKRLWNAHQDNGEVKVLHFAD